MIDWINTFALEHQWVGLSLAVFIAVHTGLKALRDALDTTPDTDDNWFEKAVTIMGKMVGYFGGVRSKKNP